MPSSTSQTTPAYTDTSLSLIHTKSYRIFTCFIMQFHLYSLLFLTISVFASPIDNARRDITVIQKSMKNVSTAIGILRSAIHSVNPKMSSAEVMSRWPDIERTSHIVTQGMNSDALEIRRGPTINLFESSELLILINELETATQQVVNEWIAIKPAINSGDKAKVISIVRDHQAASGQYADALLSRQSGLAAPAGRFFGSRTQQLLEMVVTAYAH
jgi:hypothetical protein